MFELDKLKGEVIWLTGASGGLGHGIALTLAKAGFKLALHAFHNAPNAEITAQLILESDNRAIITTGDLSDEDIVEKSYRKIIKELGTPYALVHAAGPLVRKRIIEQSSEEFDEMINGNLKSFFQAAKAVIPSMREQKCGRIITFGMAGAHQTLPMRFLGTHLAAKSGVVALTKTLAQEEAPFGITANVINPGHIEDKTVDRIQSRKIKSDNRFPMGFPGSFEDIADAILFLLSPAASYITGSVLDVTGGWMGDDR
ncbi:MAG: SDR family oxidoreductase [Candidatus Electryonea clarkiae]|nr:SDR family oxidoreductase [Candidatus Electryonea clarkiae]MDP8288920.1 SDR family oxidoreductase [Candidatus Electryonea clarkiae]